MEFKLRAFAPDDLDAVVDLSLRGWEPFFISFPGLVGAELADRLHPEWRTEQSRVVADGCANPGHLVEEAVVSSRVVGFAVVVIEAETSIGEPLRTPPPQSDAAHRRVGPRHTGRRTGADRARPDERASPGTTARDCREVGVWREGQSKPWVVDPRHAYSSCLVSF